MQPNLPDGKRPLQLNLLAGLMALIGVFFAALGVWMIVIGYLVPGLLALGLALLSAAAAWGLSKRKRWGVLLFGVAGLLGAANHLISTLNRYNAVSGQGATQVIVALFGTLIAILIPVVILYLAIVLWKQIR